MSPQKNPVLEIPVSYDPEEMQWVNAVVQFDNPKELPPKQAGWSESYMYGLKSNNVDHVLFASPTLHKKIQEVGAIKDTVVRLGRMGEGTDTRWFAKYVSGPQRSTNGQEDPTPPSPQPAQPQPPQTPPANGNPPQPQYEPAPSQMFTPMNKGAEQFIEAMLIDIEKVYWMAYDGVQDSHPKEWDNLDLQDRIERIGATATGFVITLGNQLRSMAGGWNEPAHYGAFNHYFVDANQQQEEALSPEEPAFNPDDPRWEDVKGVRSYETDEERKISLARATAMHHEDIKAYQHAGAILNRFGYTTAGTDPEVHWQMANMVWDYKDLTGTGAVSRNEALEAVAKKYNHPADLLNLFDEPENDPEPKSGTTEAEDRDDNEALLVEPQPVDQSDADATTLDPDGFPPNPDMSDTLDDEMEF